MIRSPYTNNPEAWDMAQRQSISRAEAACVLEGPRPRTSPHASVVYIAIAVVFGCIAVAHLIARLK